MSIYYITLSVLIRLISSLSSFFFFNDTATTEIYTLSLHDALPIFNYSYLRANPGTSGFNGFNLNGGSASAAYNFKDWEALPPLRLNPLDRKSTRLNSSH